MRTYTLYRRRKGRDTMALFRELLRRRAVSNAALARGRLCLSPRFDRYGSGRIVRRPDHQGRRPRVRGKRK